MTTQLQPYVITSTYKLILYLQLCNYNSMYLCLFEGNVFLPVFFLKDIDVLLRIFQRFKLLCSFCLATLSYKQTLFSFLVLFLKFHWRLFFRKPSSFTHTCFHPEGPVVKLPMIPWCLLSVPLSVL